MLPGASAHLPSASLQRNSALPDESNVARLQEELKALKVREGEAVASARELKRQLQELSDTWQVRARREGWPGRQGSRAERAPRPAGAPVPRRPLEGVPAEARGGRAAGRADERASARGPGPGRRPRAAAARGGARDAGAARARRRCSQAGGPEQHPHPGGGRAQASLTARRTTSTATCSTAWRRSARRCRRSCSTWQRRTRACRRSSARAAASRRRPSARSAPRPRPPHPHGPGRAP